MLEPAAAIYDDIRNARHAGSPHSAAIARTLAYLGWLRGGEWLPSAMLWWQQRGSDAAELAWFLAALDRLAYGLRILGIGTSKRTTRFAGVVAAIRGGRDLRAANSPLDLSSEELRSIAYNLRDLHARNPTTCRLVLLRLNDQMAGRPQGLEAGGMTVEHVLPRKHGASSPWRDWYPDPAVRDRYTESLGNLVLLTQKQNDKAANLDFAHKLEVYFRSPGAPLPVLNQSLMGQVEWTPAQIEEREDILVRHLDALWNLGAAERRERSNDGQGAPGGRRAPTRAA